MIDILIKQYINRMTFNDIDSFAKENGILLKTEELELIYGYIKRDWRTIVYGNPRSILDDLKIKLDTFTYKKIEELYIHFKDKYSDYL